MSSTSITSCKQEPGVVMPVVNLARCEGKGDCVRVCPEDVFQIRRIDDADYARLAHCINSSCACMA
jgi:4Fe-4S ferredoxin